MSRNYKPKLIQKDFPVKLVKISSRVKNSPAEAELRNVVSGQRRRRKPRRNGRATLFLSSPPPFATSNSPFLPDLMNPRSFSSCSRILYLLEAVSPSLSPSRWMSKVLGNSRCCCLSVINLFLRSIYRNIKFEYECVSKYKACC